MGDLAFDNSFTFLISFNLCPNGIPKDSMSLSLRHFKPSREVTPSSSKVVSYFSSFKSQSNLDNSSVWGELKVGASISICDSSSISQNVVGKSPHCCSFTSCSDAAISYGIFAV